MTDDSHKKRTRQLRARILIALRNFAVSWLLAFVIAWKLTHDRSLALAGATILAALLVLFLALI